MRSHSLTGKDALPALTSASTDGVTVSVRTLTAPGQSLASDQPRPAAWRSHRRLSHCIFSSTRGQNGPNIPLKDVSSRRTPCTDKPAMILYFQNCTVCCTVCKPEPGDLDLHKKPGRMAPSHNPCTRDVETGQYQEPPGQPV